jgi:LysR family transcriptional regulator for metE and metH
MRDLEIKHLRMIQMIAGTRNLTKAAEKLYISQPALSQQLMNIENKIGADLFFRNGKKMILTRVGKKLLDSAHIILEEIERAEREVAQEVNGEKGELKVGVRCIFCFKLIPEVIKEFQDKYPNVDLEIGHSQQPEKDLLSRAFDITVSSATIANRKISYVPLFDAEFVCVMSGDHPLGQRRYLEVEDFEGEDMISLAEKANSSFYNYFLKEKGVRLRRFMTIPYPETILNFAEAGLGIAILPKWFVSAFASTKNIHSCRFTSKRYVRHLRAHYLKQKSVPSYQDEFIKTIVSHTVTV